MRYGANNSNALRLEEILYLPGAPTGPKIVLGWPQGVFPTALRGPFSARTIFEFFGLAMGQMAKSQMGQKVKFEFNHFSVDLSDST